MPSIVKQRIAVAKATTLSTNGTHAMRGEGIKLLEYGRGKTGKTRLAATFPKPQLMIGVVEDGTKSIKSNRTDSGKRLSDGTVIWSLTLRGKPLDIDYFLLQTSSQFPEATQLVVDGGYKSSCLDHAGGFQDVILKDVKGLAGTPVLKDWGMAQQSEWGIVNAQFCEHLNRYLALAERFGVDIAVIAHERNFKSEGAMSDIMVPSVGAALTPGAAGWLNGACDYICQTFIRLKVREEVGTIAGQEQTVQVQTNEPEFCLRVGPHPVFSTGFRLEPGAVLPECIVDPTYEKIIKVIKGEKL